LQNPKRADELFDAALEVHPDARARFLAEQSLGDPLLAANVNSLLVFAERAEAQEFMKDAALEVSAKAFVADLEAQRTGQLFGRYQILSLIGEGGMGQVYLARDTDLNRQVALKLVSGSLPTKDILRRFRNERQILASLQHPNIAQLLDGSSTAEGLPFFVMEYVEGKPLNDYADDQALSITERLKLFRTVCAAISYAHQNLVIHLDVKPSNILVTADGIPKLLDFGIAKLLNPVDAAGAPAATATVMQVMTPEYASPEQVKGEPVTTATDVYSLGVVLYELLTGHRPHKISSRSPADIINEICVKETERPSAALSKRNEQNREKRSARSSAGPTTQIRHIQHASPIFEGGIEKLRRRLKGDIDNIVLMAMRKEPQRRYSSVGHFAEDITRHLEGLPVIARQDTFAYRSAKFVGRNKITASAAAVMLLLLVGGIVATAWEAHVARAQQAKTERRFNEVRKLAHAVLFDYHDAIANLSGSTPVRERLVKDALEYLDSLAQDAVGDVSLQRELATAYIRVGDVQGRPYRSNLGQTDGALTSYRKALVILEPLSGGDLGNLELKRDLAIAYERIGTIQLRKGNAAESFEKTNKALVIREALLSTDPSSTNYLSELADSYIYFGDALGMNCSSPNLDCVRQALEIRNKALDIRSRLANVNPSDPQIRRDLAQAYTRVGFGLSNAADGKDLKEHLRKALESHQQALAIRAGLAAENPDNAFDRRNLGDQYMLVGDALVRNGNLAESLDRYVKALAIFKELSAADPSNAEARLDLGFALTKLGAAEVNSHNEKLARKYFKEAVPILDRLIAEDPTNSEACEALKLAYSALTEGSEKAGDLVTAIDSYRRIVTLLERRREVDSPGSTQNELAISYANLGNLYEKAAGINGITTTQRTERWSKAKEQYQKGLDAWRKIIGLGSSTQADFEKRDKVVREIAKCDAALGRK
jgi:serine/threonine protein kinase/tetratricopeptide (TPR) repeat protein